MSSYKFLELTPPLKTHTCLRSLKQPGALSRLQFPDLVPQRLLASRAPLSVCSFRDYPYSSHYDLVSDEHNYFYFLFKLLNWRAVSLSDSTLTIKSIRLLYQNIFEYQN